MATLDLGKAGFVPMPETHRQLSKAIRVSDFILVRVLQGCSRLPVRPTSHCMAYPWSDNVESLQLAHCGCPL
jgi:hypothetical protein